MLSSIEQADLINQLLGLWAQFGPLILDYTIIFLRSILILFVGMWLARWLSKQVKKAFDKFTDLDATLKSFIPLSLRYGVWVITLVVLLGQLGVQTASIIALLGAAGIAIGLALQGTLQNIAAGLMLLFLRPFQVGDYIEAGSINGTVKQVGLFNTEMLSIRGQYMAVPNSNLWNVTIINFSRNPNARLDIDISIAYEDDIDVGLAALQKLADNDPDILKDPAPQCFVAILAASSVDIRLRCWVPSSNQWQTHFRLNREVKLAVEAAGCTIPYPQRVVHIGKAKTIDMITEEGSK